MRLQKWLRIKAVKVVIKVTTKKNIVLCGLKLFSFRKKSDKVRKELEEACRESGSRSSGSGSSEDKILDSIPYYATVLPNKVAVRFVSLIF